MSKQAKPPEKTGFALTQSGEVVLRLSPKDASAFDALDASNSADFGVLAKAARLNPKTDFIGRDLSGLPLGASKSDLRGFVFRDANLTGTGVREALIDETTDFTNARLDPADAAEIKSRFPGPPPPDFDMEKVQAMILRGEAPPKAWVPWITFLNFGPTDFGGADLPGKEGLTNLAPLASLANLQILSLDNTQVSDTAPLATLANLQMLSLTNTLVSDIAPLATLANLQMLLLDNTQVSDITPLASLANLQRLWLTNTQVSDISPLASLANLQTLLLTRTQVSDIAALASFDNLQELWLNALQVSDIAPLATLANLRMLLLANTQVSDIAPLASLANLQTLWLANTQVSDIAPLATLANLHELWLSYTEVSDISPLRDLPNLTHVRVESLGRARMLARTLGKKGVVTTKKPHERGTPHIRPLAQRRMRSAAKRPPGGA